MQEGKRILKGPMSTFLHKQGKNPQEAALFKRFEQLKITVKTSYHPAFHTVEEAIAGRANMPGGHCKTLFLKSKRGAWVLIVMDEKGRLDVNHLSKELGLGRLSFASADHLYDKLGVRPGAVTPFAVMNWPAGLKLHMLLHAHMMAQSPLHYHPLHNEATCAIHPRDLLKFIDDCGIEPIIRDLPLK